MGNMLRRRVYNDHDEDACRQRGNHYCKLADVIIAAIVNAVNYIQMCSVIENWGVLLSSPPKNGPGPGRDWPLQDQKQ